MAYNAMGCAVLTSCMVLCGVRIWCYAMRGTKRAYGAIGSAVGGSKPAGGAEAPVAKAKGKEETRVTCGHVTHQVTETPNQTQKPGLAVQIAPKQGANRIDLARGQVTKEDILLEFLHAVREASREDNVDPSGNSTTLVLEKARFHEAVDMLACRSVCCYGSAACYARGMGCTGTELTYGGAQLAYVLSERMVLPGCEGGGRCRWSLRCSASKHSSNLLETWDTKWYVEA
eukprot:2766130-Rhodomonas_salina.1